MINGRTSRQNRRGRRFKGKFLRNNRTEMPALSGFSLIEVNLAILVIAVGMLALMALFPLGLRESSLAQGDMVQSAAADYILGQIRSRAQMITNYAEWDQTNNTISRIAEGFEVEGTGQLRDFPGPGNTTRYRLRIHRCEEREWRYLVSVQASERQTGSFSDHPWFYTEVIYHGNP